MSHRPPAQLSNFLSNAVGCGLGGVAILIAAFGCGGRSDLTCVTCATANQNDSGFELGGVVDGPLELFPGEPLDAFDPVTGVEDAEVVNSDDPVPVPMPGTIGGTEDGLLGGELVSEPLEPDDFDSSQLPTNPGGFRTRDFCPGQLVETEEQLQALAGCAAIAGDLDIRIDPPVSLSPLGSMRQVEGTLTLTGVASLSGLFSLQHVGNLTIEGTQLTELSTLRNLETIGEGQLRVVGNPLLEDIGGLRKLVFTISLVVQDNPVLKSISQSSFGPRISNVSIYRNPLLERVEPLGVPNLGEVELSGASLKDFDLLEGVVAVGRLILFNTPSLENTSGLRDILAVPQLLRLQATNMENLDDLSTLRAASQIIITSEDSLTNVDGISQISTVDSLTIERTSALVSLPSFPEIQEMRDLSITRNVLLATGPRFPRLQRLETLRFVDNPQWGSLLGLESLVSVENLDISHNDKLASLSLPALQAVTDQLVVRCNAQLPVAELSEFESVDVQRLVESGNLDSTVACTSPSSG